MTTKRKVKSNPKTDWGSIAHKSTKGDASAQYICTFVNPVDKRLYNVIEVQGSTELVAPFMIQQYREVGEKIPMFAEGHFDNNDEKEIDGGTYYRSHTPSGVVEKGRGYGYLLYSGLAVAVVMLRGEDGIFSQKAMRSSDATRWWAAQVEQGYALESTDEMYGTTTVEVDVEDQINAEDIDAEYALGSEAEDLSIEDVDPRSVQAEVEVRGTVSIQYLSARQVAQEGIVIAWNPEDSDLDELFSDAKFPDVEVLSELNLDTVEDPSLIAAVFKLIHEDKASTDEMRMKLLSTVDDEVWAANEEAFIRLAGKQLELPLVENRRKRRVKQNGKPTYSRAWKKYFGDALQTDPNLM